MYIYYVIHYTTPKNLRAGTIGRFLTFIIMISSKILYTKIKNQDQEQSSVFHTGGGKGGTSPLKQFVSPPKEWGKHPLLNRSILQLLTNCLANIFKNFWLWILLLFRLHSFTPPTSLHLSTPSTYPTQMKNPIWNPDHADNFVHLNQMFKKIANCQSFFLISRHNSGLPWPFSQFKSTSLYKKQCSVPLVLS